MQVVLTGGLIQHYVDGLTRAVRDRNFHYRAMELAHRVEPVIGCPLSLLGMSQLGRVGPV